jgi:hypothetical protein
VTRALIFFAAFFGAIVVPQPHRARTAAGWQWRQVFFFSPPWLRWLHG